MPFTMNASGMLARLQSAQAAITPMLDAANQNITASMQSTLDELYGPRLGKHWQLEQIASEVGAEVHVWTDNEYVRGYEFGTRPHRITPRSARVLAFAVGGAQVFTARVQHPGTRGHFHGPAVELALQMTARSEWTDALEQALNQ